MDSCERDRLGRINREAALEKTADDPHATAPDDSTPLALFMAGALALTTLILVVMWVSNSHYDGTVGKPVAEHALTR